MEEAKSYAEILAIAKSHFGDGADVEWSVDSGWKIITNIEESFDPEEFKGTPAYTFGATFEHNYGSELERWAWKSGLSEESEYGKYEAYNDHMAKYEHDFAVKVLKTLETNPELFESSEVWQGVLNNVRAYARKHNMEVPGE